GEFTRAATAFVDTDAECVAGCFTETEHQTVRKLPILETPSIRSWLEAIRRDPIRAAHINVERKITAFQHAIGHIEKADAARTTQEFSRRRGEKITSQARDVNGNFADGLAGIDEVGHAGGFGDFSKCFDRLNEPRIRGHPGYGEEPNTRIAQEFADPLPI